MKRGRTHLINHPDVDYAIVFDSGEVALYLANTAGVLARSVADAREKFGELKEYKPGMPVPRRPKTALPAELSISDQALALLVPLEQADARGPTVDEQLDDASRAASSLASSRLLLEDAKRLEDTDKISAGGTVPDLTDDPLGIEPASSRSKKR